MPKKSKVVSVSGILRFLLSLWKVDNKEDKRTRLTNSIGNDLIIIYLIKLKIVTLYSIILCNLVNFLLSRSRLKSEKSRALTHSKDRLSSSKNCLSFQNKDQRGCALPYDEFFRADSLREVISNEKTSERSSTLNSIYFSRGDGSLSADASIYNVARMLIGEEFSPEKDFHDLATFPYKEITEINGKLTGGTTTGKHHVGDEVVYTIYWRNDSEQSKEITIVDFLTHSLDFISATDNGVYDSASSQVIWKLGMKNSGESNKVELKVRVNEDALVIPKIENRAYVNEVVTNTVESYPIGKGTLEVSKKILGTEEDKAKRFLFTVMLEENTLNGNYGEMEFRDGIASFSLSDNEVIRASELPAECRYVVTEINAHGCDTESTGDSGEISSEEIVRAEFVNSCSPAEPKTLPEITLIENSILEYSRSRHFEEKGKTNFKNKEAITLSKEQSLNGNDRTQKVLKAKEWDRITYYLSVENTGKEPLEGIEITDSIPEGMELISIASGGTCKDEIVSWNIDLRGFSTEVLSFDCRIEDKSKTFENTAKALFLNATFHSNTVKIEVPDVSESLVDKVYESLTA